MTGTGSVGTAIGKDHASLRVTSGTWYVDTVGTHNDAIEITDLGFKIKGASGVWNPASNYDQHIFKVHV